MPFCPQCGDEFQDWVTTCPDCQAALTSKRPPARKAKARTTPAELVVAEIYSDPEQVERARELLSARGIRTYVFDGQMPVNEPVFVSSPGGISLRVDKTQVEKAQQILAEHREEIKGKKVAPAICPVCGSESVTSEGGAPSALLLSLLGFAKPRSLYWLCRNCNYTWVTPVD
jgi:hypothetical protein